MCIFAFDSSSSFLTLFPCCLSIQLFCYIYLVAIFCSQIVLFPCHPAVGMSSCNLPLLAGRIFFIILECPVLSILFYSVLISF